MFESQDLKSVEDYLVKWFERPDVYSRSLLADPAVQKLTESIRYTLLGPGKRFRPQLVLAVAELLGMAKAEFVPFACAIEMVHNYSLIHDDLPSMDNDDERRGRPTLHKIAGEGMALLAGDALLTEAFSVIALEYSKRPHVAVSLIQILAEAAGPRGMIAGQVMDVFTNEFSSQEKILELHRLKTGALISACVVGAVAIGEVEGHRAQVLKKFGDYLGVSFQIADDLLDFHQENQKDRNLAHFMSEQAARTELERISEQAKRLLQDQFATAEPLLKFVKFNLSRAH